jgi:hypothetical protein
MLYQESYTYFRVYYLFAKLLLYLFMFNQNQHNNLFNFELEEKVIHIIYTVSVTLFTEYNNGPSVILMIYEKSYV